MQAFKRTPSFLWPTFYRLDVYPFIHVTIEMSIWRGGGAEADMENALRKFPSPAITLWTAGSFDTAAYFENPRLEKSLSIISGSFYWFSTKIFFFFFFCTVSALLDITWPSRDGDGMERDEMRHRSRVSLHLRPPSLHGSSYCVIPVSGLWLECDMKTACRGN